MCCFDCQIVVLRFWFWMHRYLIFTIVRLWEYEMHTIMIKTAKNVRTFSRCPGRSQGPEQKARLATHLPAGMTGGAIWFTWSHVFKQWWCGHVGILPWGASHGSDREWHAWHVQWMEMRGATLCDFIRTGHLFLIHSGPLPSDSEPCWKNCQAGKPCKGHNPGLGWASQFALT